jgi:His/Glu/Gln/Arg/opine family amino acid ABC transporter permease subunit
MSFEFKTEVMVETLPLLLGGAQLIIIITVAGLVAGFALGSIFGLMKLSSNKILKWFASIYVEIIRGTLLIVQVMFLYFGLPVALGVRIDPIMAGLLPLHLILVLIYLKLYVEQFSPLTVGKLKRVVLLLLIKHRQCFILFGRKHLGVWSLL